MNKNIIFSNFGPLIIVRVRVNFYHFFIWNRPRFLFKYPSRLRRRRRRLLA
jgi:hypothetical protein